VSAHGDASARLLGRCVVITGAAAGIGLTLAIAAAEHGANVVIADVDRPAARAAAANVGKYGHGVLAVEGDVRSGDEVADMARRAERAFGRLDARHGPTGCPNRPCSR
jgi:NAD(P)-dependent dehydrogenase (short-subunit alcohol dehydrogenase family)